MFLYTFSSPQNQERHTLFQAGTDAVGHLHVQTLKGATVLTSKYIDTHTNTLSMWVEKVWVVLIKTLEESTVNLNLKGKKFWSWVFVKAIECHALKCGFLDYIIIFTLKF